MEGSEKINGKKRLPSIPPNYVTLLQLQERWVKDQEQKQKEKEEHEEPQREQEEKEKQVEERVGDEVAGRESPKKGYFRRYDRETGKPKEEEIAVSPAVNGSEDFEKEKKGEELKNKKKKWSNKRKKKKEEKAGTENKGEEVLGPALNAPLPAIVENNKREEEVIVDEGHAPKQASAEARRELNPRIMNRTKDRTVEIGRRFRAMSVKGEIRTGDYCRYGNQNGHFNHRGGNRELNQRSEGMVWVKKGGVNDGSGIKSSSSSSKALD